MWPGVPEPVEEQPPARPWRPVHDLAGRQRGQFLALHVEGDPGADVVGAADRQGGTQPGDTTPPAEYMGAVLGAVPPDDAGIASAVNNAVARVAGLVVVALAGVIVGGVLDVGSFHRALVVTAGLLALGGVLSLAGIRRVRPAAPAR